MTIKKRLHVVVFAHDSSMSSGAPRWILRLCIAMTNYPVRFTVVVPSNGQLVESLRARSVAVVVIEKFPPLLRAQIANGIRGIPGNAIRVLYRGLYLFRVAYFLKTHDVDVVHLNTLINVSAAVAAALVNRRILWHIHESDYHFSRLRGLRIRVASHVGATFVAVSHSVARQLVAFGIPGHRVRVIPNGIDADETEADSMSQSAAAEQLVPKGPKVLVGTVGHISRTKGTDLFIDVACLVAHERPNAAFIVVGPAGPRAQDRQLQLDVKRAMTLHPLQGRAAATGYVECALGLIREMDIVVVPSRSEPFAQVVLEAMALSKPIVATSVGGAAEAILDGETGYLTPAVPAELTAAVVRLIDDEALRKAMGMRGALRVRRLFSLTRFAQDIFSAYQDVCPERSVTLEAHLN